MNHSFSVEHAVKYGIEEAILIGNFQFWLAKNRADERNQYDGRTWTYNTAAALAELIPYFSVKKVYRVLDSLVTLGVIMKGNYNENPRDQTRWFAFVNEAEFLPATDLRKKAKEAKEAKKSAGKTKGKGLPPVPENGNSSSRKREMEIPESGTPIPENGNSLYRTDITTDVTTDKNLQTAAAAAPEACAGEPAASVSGEPVADSAPAEQPTAAAERQGPSEAFEAAWEAYPVRSGNAKPQALSAWKARVSEGVTEKALLDGAKDYAAHCQREKVAPKFVMTAGRFFGTEGHYAADWSALSDQQPSFFDPEYDHADNIEAI